MGEEQKKLLEQQLLNIEKTLKVKPKLLECKKIASRVLDKTVKLVDTFYDL